MARLHDLVIQRIEAHLKGDGRRCAELDVAGMQIENRDSYWPVIRKLEHLTDEQLAELVHTGELPI